MQPRKREGGQGGQRFLQEHQEITQPLRQCQAEDQQSLADLRKTAEGEHLLPGKVEQDQGYPQDWQEGGRQIREDPADHGGN